MPLTPFHLGPGALLRAIGPKHFSFRVFFASQVVMDCETGWNILNHNERLHTTFHTYLGALIPAAITFALWIAYRKLARIFPVVSGRPLAIKVVSLSVFVGVWSHVLLDSIMHRDLFPFAPFTEENGMSGAVPLLTLYVACVISGLLGIAILVFRKFFRST